MSRSGSNRRGAGGARVENFPGFTTLQILAKNHKMMTETKYGPDIAWREKGNEAMCIANSNIVAEFAKRFAHGHWSFLGPGSEKKWNGTHTYKPTGKWDRVAAEMMLNFTESGHPVFRGSSALERGDLKSEGNGKLSIHFCGDDCTVEVVLRTIISVNQLSIYGALAGHVRRAGLQNL